MAGLTLDAGALIAVDRDDRRFWRVCKDTLRRGAVVTVPATALAQAWRGPPSARLAQLLAACEVVPLTESLAKDVGELCARTRTRDVVDASVVLIASVRGSDVLTGDPADLRKLATAVDGVRIVDLRSV